MLKIQSI